jgi:pimeloyl-ACP methyl ester carboxylesterase
MLSVEKNRAPVVLVHGAANSSLVWSLWQKHLAELGWFSHALDLRGHGSRAGEDLSTATMADYAASVKGLYPADGMSAY